MIPQLIEKAKGANAKLTFKKFENDKDFFYNFFMLSADTLCLKNSKNCASSFVGVDYGIIKSYIKKKIILDENFSGEKFISLDEMRKMTLKERLSIKNEQLTKNLNNNIYEDIQSYIKNEVKELVVTTKKNYEMNQNNIFDQVVIKDVNNIIINNMLDNNRFYIGLLIVKNERLDHLYETLKEAKTGVINKI